MNALLQRLGTGLARYLSQPRHMHSVAGAMPLDLLRGCLQPADVVLVEGNSRISTAIKYLTQSTWPYCLLAGRKRVVSWRRTPWTVCAALACRLSTGCTRGSAGGTPATAPPQPVRAAGFRCLTLLFHDQA